MKSYPADDADAKGTAFRRCERDAPVRGLIASHTVDEALAKAVFWKI